eukprot:SAG22_NODE_2159_length_2917_cov_2.452094_1_plen_477_part_10
MAEQVGVEMTEPQLDKMIAQMDEDADGSISPEEFETWWQVNLLAETIAEAIDEDDEGHVMQEEVELLLTNVNSLLLAETAATAPARPGREDWAGRVVADPAAKAKAICVEFGIGEFVAVEDFADQLINLYGVDKPLFVAIEELASTLPPPLSRGMPSIHAAAVQLLQAMDACEGEIKAILVAQAKDDVFKLEEYVDEDGFLNLNLAQICDVLIAQCRRRGVVGLLTSANFEKLAKLAKAVRECQPQLLAASSLGWGFLLDGADAALGLVSFFKTADKNTAERCRDAILGMRDVGTQAAGGGGPNAAAAGSTGGNLIAAVGSGKFSAGGADAGGGADGEVQECKLVGRDNLLTELCRTMTNDGSCVLVHGRHGVGKSALLSECNRRLRDGFAYCCFISALTEVALYEGLLHFAHAHVDAVPADAPLTAAVVEAVKAWLREEEDWLFIVDNAHDPARLLGIFPEKHGHVLFAADHYQPW